MSSTPNVAHYHVLMGQPGCLPDVNETYPTKREAQDGAMFWARMCRDGGEILDGNKRDGYRNLSMNTTIEITSVCHDGCVVKCNACGTQYDPQESMNRCPDCGERA